MKRCGDEVVLTDSKVLINEWHCLSLFEAYVDSDPTFVLTLRTQNTISIAC